MKIPSTVLLLLLTALPLPGQSAPSEIPANVARYEQVLLRRPEAGPAFERVVEYYRTGPGTEALEERWSAGFDAATTPAERAGWATLAGILAQQQGDNEAAADWFEKALSADPDQVKTRIALGELLANSGRFAEAIAVLQKGLKPEEMTDPDQGELYRQLALTQERDFQTENAIATWKILANQPGVDSFTLEEAAEALARNQDYEAAQKIFEKLAELSANDPYQRVRFQIRLARLKEASGNYDEALAIYRQAMPRTSGTSWLQKELRSRVEQLFRKQEDLPGLADYYTTQLEERGPDSETALLLARVLDELGRDEEATGWILKATEWSPSRTDLSLLLAERFLEADDPDEAIQVLEPLAAADPANKLVAERLGTAYWIRFEATDAEEDRAFALAEWNRIAPADSATASEVTHLAEVLRRHEWVEESLAAYERAAGLDPDSIDIREQWADWLFVLEQPEDAWEVLSGIVATGEQQTAARFLRLAQLRKRYGDRSAALDAIERGLLLEPDSYDLLSLQWSVLAEEERWADAADLYEALAAAAPNDFFRRSVDQRHIQALAASEQMVPTRDQLKGGLGSGTLSANDLGLLLRIAIAMRDVETAQRTIEEIQGRFSESVPLYEITLSYYEEQGKYDEAIAALETLTALAPRRADEWLQRKATLQLDLRRYEEASATAKERVALNPAKIEAQLFLAEIYQNEGRTEKAIETLETGIRLAEDPSPIRQRLIDYLSSYGYSEEAYEQTWTLFEEADSLQARLATVPQLSNLALQQGKLDELIRDFERKRMSEEDGYRYALFLASIYESVGDFAAARKNLVEALAARPQDVVLIQQILSLAKEENDWEDYARFSRELADIEPSPENIFTHLEALLQTKQSDAMFEWLSSNQEVFLRNIDELRTMLVGQSENAEEVLRLFGRSLRQKDGDAKAQLALGELLLATKDFEGAEESFWRILLMEEPPSKPAPSPTTRPGIHPYAQVRHGALGTRLNYSHRARNQATQLILAETSRRYHGIRFPNHPSPTFEQIQDTALIYLAALAVRDERTDEFLAQLNELLERRPDPVREKMIAYALLNESERARESAESLLASENLDRTTLEEVQNITLRNAYPHSMQGDSEAVDLALEMIETLRAKWADIDPQQTGSLDVIRLMLLNASERTEEAKTLAQEILSDIDIQDPTDFQKGLTAIHMTGDYGRTSEWLREYLTNPKLQSIYSGYGQQIILGIIYAPLFQNQIPKGVDRIDPAEGMEITLKNLRVYWENARAPKRTTGSQPNYGHQTGPFDFPGNNRWVSSYERHLLERLSKTLITSPEVSAQFTESLGEIAADLEGHSRIQALLTLAIWQDLQGNPEASAPIALTLTQEFPQYPELRLLAAQALILTEEYEATLEQIKQARFQTFAEKQTRMIIKLKALTSLERREEAQALAKEFFAQTAQIDYRTRNLLQQMDLDPSDFRKAPKLNSRNAIASSLRSSDWNQTRAVIERMQQLDRDGNKAEARKIAELILSNDPSQSPRNNESYLRDRALEVYLNDNDGEALAETLNEQLEAAPNSAFLHYRLAELALRAKSRNKSHAPFEPHVEKVLQLRPYDTDLLKLLANRLSDAQEHEKAAELYAQILKDNPAEILNNSHTLVRAFINAQQVDLLYQMTQDPEFMRKVTAANSWGLSNLLQRIGDQLENEDRFEEALRFRSLAFEHLDWNNQLNQIGPVLDLQVKLGRVEEARETLWNTVFAGESDDGEKVDSRFGFDNSNSRRQSLFNHTSYLNLSFTIRGVELLDRVNQLGLNDRVLAWVNEDPPDWLSDAEATLIDILVRINQQDPTVIPELQDEDFPKTLQSGMIHQRNQILFTIAERLASWEEGRRAAFQLYQSTFDSPGFSYSGNSYEENILSRSAIALTELARTDEEVEAANQFLKRRLKSAQTSFRGTTNVQISREITTELLTAAIRQDILTGDELQDWLEMIRKVPNWGSYSDSTAAYLEALTMDEVSAPLYPALIEGETVRPMALANSLLQLDPNRGKERMLDASFFALPEDTSLYATPDPDQPPVALPPGAPLPESLSAALPGGFGYLFLARVDESPEGAPQQRWATVSILPNLLSYPDPALAPIAPDTSFPRKGWAELPPSEIESTLPPEHAPIRRGNRISAEGDYNRKTLLSALIPIEKDTDLLLSGWFGGLDASGNEGYLSFGLTFFDEAQEEIRTRSERATMPFDELWAPLSILCTAQDSARHGQYEYPGNVRYVQVKLEIEPGVVFGGLHLSAIPAAAEGESTNVRDTLRAALEAARNKQAEKASNLYFQALQQDPGRAVSYWRNNDESWTTAIQTGGRMADIFRFLANPGVHDESSFRYYRRTVRDRNDLSAIAEFAIQNSDTPGAEALLDTVFLQETCLEDEQRNRLLLKARSTGIRSASPEENLRLGLKTLNLLKKDDSSNSLSESEWEEALLYLEQLDLLPAVLETLQDVDGSGPSNEVDVRRRIMSPSPKATSVRRNPVRRSVVMPSPQATSVGRSVVIRSPAQSAGTASRDVEAYSLVPPEATASRLVQAYILAQSDPAASSLILSELADNGPTLSENDLKRGTLILGRMASTESGVTRSPELLASIKEAEFEWILLEPDRNTSRIREIIKTLVSQQDFEAARRIEKAIAETSSHFSIIRPYNHVFPRLTEPSVESLWPVALTGSVDTDGSRTVLIRFHPDNNYPPESLDGGTPRLTTEPLLETIPGLERVELQFGPFPAELETVAEFTGAEATREVSVQLPAKNGFLRAVAYVDNREISGPITPVFTGRSVSLLNPKTPTLPLPAGPFNALPPSFSDLIPITKNQTIRPDLSKTDWLQHSLTLSTGKPNSTGIDWSQQDLILLAWGVSQRGQSTVRSSPRYSENDPNAYNTTKLLTGELTLFTALVPGQSGRDEITALERLDVRIYNNSQLSPVQMVAVDREQSEYLLWMSEVRKTAAQISSGEEIPTSELAALAGRDPYGSAGYLLEKLVPAIIESGGPAEAIEYLQQLDPSNASPFHLNWNYSDRIQNELVGILQNHELPDEVRWQAALTLLRIPEIDPIYRIEHLYEAAGSDPSRRQYAREQKISWLKGENRPKDMADYQLKSAIGNYHISRGNPHNHLNNILIEDHDEEIDQLIRRRLSEANYNLENQPGKDFVLATLLAEPNQTSRIDKKLDQLLTSNRRPYDKARYTVVGVENLEARGFTPEDRQELLLQAVEALLEYDPLGENSYPTRGLIIINGAIFRNNPGPPIPPIIEIAKWLTKSTENPKTRTDYLCSKNTYVLIDYLEQVGEDEVRNQLLTAIRQKAEGTRDGKNLNSRFPK